MGAYPSPDSEVDMEKLQKNTIDPFKIIFDCSFNNVEVDDWVKTEQIRQEDKTINNRIGDFHQKLLGGVKGWVDLGTGDDSHVDLKKEDNSIFIEIKNKFNTVNSSSLSSLQQKLEAIIKKYPKATGYWGFILSKRGDSGETILSANDRTNPRIKKIWGSKFYELVTNDPNALSDTWKALPKAIKDIQSEARNFTGEDKKRLKYFFKSAFSNLTEPEL